MQDVKFFIAAGRTMRKPRFGIHQGIPVEGEISDQNNPSTST